jgi:glutathione S-transferase
MKLYNMNLSNFATKSRLVIYEKGLNVEMVPIPGGDLHSAEYAKVNPLGKTPALEVDGLLIPESEVINEYLEDKYPAVPLLPKSPEGRAKVRILTRFHDLYLEPPMRALFYQMDPKTRDEKLVAEKVADFKNRLDQLEKMLADSGFACGADFTLADCALVPSMFFATNLMPLFGLLALDGRPKLAAWWTRVQSRPSVKKGLAEMSEALAAMQRGGGAH